MSDPELEIDLGPEVNPIVLKSWEEVYQLIKGEEGAWRWLSPQAHNPASIGEVIQERFRFFRDTFQNQRSSGLTVDALQGLLLQIFNPINGPIFPSQSAKGRQVLELREYCGEDGAAVAYAFMLGRMQLGNVTSQNQLRAILISTFPPFDSVVDLSDRLSRERANLRATQRNTLAELQAFESRRESEWRGLIWKASRVGVRRLRDTRARWLEDQKTLSQKQADAINDINSVKNAYEESMRLLGPVRYWAQKSKNHGKSEFYAVLRLVIFFPITIGFLSYIFYEAFSILLHGDPSRPGAPLPQSAYFVISAGLLLITTFSFWIGRLLTKLYLSEHHLRIDAHERAVMTTTYLALIRSGAAGEAERPIILEALFRQSSDGIVKDDGPDMSLGAILSRAVTR